MGLRNPVPDVLRGGVGEGDVETGGTWINTQTNTCLYILESHTRLYTSIYSRVCPYRVPQLGST